MLTPEVLPHHARRLLVRLPDEAASKRAVSTRSYAAFDPMIMAASATRDAEVIAQDGIRWVFRTTVARPKADYDPLRTTSVADVLAARWSAWTVSDTRLSRRPDPNTRTFLLALLSHDRWAQRS